MQAESRLVAPPKLQLGKSSYPGKLLHAKSIKGLMQAKSRLTGLPELKPGKISSCEITQGLNAGQITVRSTARA